MSLRLMKVDEASGAAVVDERPPKYVVALTGASQAGLGSAVWPSNQVVAPTGVGQTAVGPRATEG